MSDVVIRIRLDEQAQTRVDMRATCRFTVVGDFEGNTRLIDAFTHALDRKLIAASTPPVLISPEDAGFARGETGRDQHNEPGPGGSDAPVPGGTAASGTTPPASSGGG